jgi:hypothetical protein
MNIRINGQTPPQILGAKQPSRQNSATFSISETQVESGFEEAQNIKASSSLLGLDGLLAIQSNEHDVLSDKRRRQMKKSRFRLDQLDRLKLGLLEGELDMHVLDALENDLKGGREAIEDEDLQSLLNAIELRSRVELAKRGRL